MTTHTVGIDISKDTLDVHLHPTGEDRRFTNDAKGCQSRSKMGQFPGAIVPG